MGKSRDQRLDNLQNSAKVFSKQTKRNRIFSNEKNQLIMDQYVDNDNNIKHKE